jgi:hypothetical protein
MTNPKLTKLKITEAVVKELPLSSQQDIGDVDKILSRWWATGRQDGLRLTEYGDLNFRMAEIEFYEFGLESDIKKNPKQEWHLFLLECNRKIKCPYYLGVNTIDKKKIPYIRFYDSKIAMMVQLYGSLRDYLNSVKDKR